jgi:N6-adenosine-specific RNA methylase IME4
MDVSKKKLVPNGGGGELIAGPFSLTRTGLVVEGEPTEEEWDQAGDKLCQAHGALQWWIGDWLLYGEGKPEWGEKYAKARKRFGKEEQALKDYKTVAKSVKLSYRNDNLSWTHHRAVAPLPPAEQKNWLKKAEKQGWSVTELRKEIRQKQKDRDRKDNPLPPGKFAVIYADPPWEYNDQRTGTVESGSASAQYRTLTVEELCELADDNERGPKDLRTEDAVLFLWATAPMLPEALRVMTAWGFAYKTHFVWDKVRGYNGHYSNVRHELLLIGTHGSCQPAAKELLDSIVEIEKTAHSAKPDRFCEIVETLYPEGPYVELFARRKRKGWTVWGNQA